MGDPKKDDFDVVDDFDAPEPTQDAWDASVKADADAQAAADATNFGGGSLEGVDAELAARPEIVAPAVAEAPAEAKTPSSPSKLDTVLRAMKTGFSGGLSNRFVNDMIGGAVDDGTGIPREYAAGSREADNLKTLNAEDQQAHDANPVLSTATEIASSIPMTIAAGGTGLLGAGLTAGALGGMRAYGASDSPDDVQALKDAAPAAALSTVLGAGGKYAGDKAGRLAGYVKGKLGPRLAKVADAQLLRQGGAMKGDLDAMAKTGGLRKYAQGARDLKIGGELKPIENFAEDASALAGDVVDGAHVPGTLDKARMALARDTLEQGVPAEEIATKILGLRHNYPQGPGMEPLRNAVGVAAADAAKMGGQAGTPAWDKLNKVRQYWGRGTNFAQGSPQAEIRQGVYGKLNDALEGTIEAAQPGAGEAWRKLGRDEQVAIKLRDIAQNRLRGLTANRVISPSDYASLGLGAIAGGGAGYHEGGVGGGAGGAAAGALLANRILKGKEHGLMSLLARKGSELAPGVSRALSSLGTAPAVVGSAAGQAVAPHVNDAVEGGLGREEADFAPSTEGAEATPEEMERLEKWLDSQDE